jgi:hypothetical protein
MRSQMTKEELWKHADSLRERALTCIRLAEMTTDKQMHEKLLALSKELIGQANQLRMTRELQSNDDG